MFYQYNMIRHVAHLAWQTPGAKTCIRCIIVQNSDQYAITVSLPKQSTIVVVRSVDRRLGAIAARGLGAVSSQQSCCERLTAASIDRCERPARRLDTVISVQLIIRYQGKIIYRFYNGFSCPFAFQTEYINCVDQRTYYCYYHANGAIRSVDISCRTEYIHHDGRLACNQCKNVIDYSAFIEEAFPDIVQRFMNFIRGKK